MRRELHGGRLVKLLGDGAMLRLGNATVGVGAALDLVETMTGEGALSPHAGIDAGPVIERDLDVFGQTVNLASRIADVAGPGEVLASEAVVRQPRRHVRVRADRGPGTQGTSGPGRPLPRVAARASGLNHFRERLFPIAEVSVVADGGLPLECAP